MKAQWASSLLLSLLKGVKEFCFFSRRDWVLHGSHRGTTVAYEGPGCGRQLATDFVDRWGFWREGPLKQEPQEGQLE